MPNLKITFLGTGSGTSIHRAQTAIVLDCDDGTRLLLDASSGNSVLTQASQVGMLATSFDQLLLTQAPLRTELSSEVEVGLDDLCLDHHLRRFGVDGGHESRGRYGSPDIFNTDQGSQFTSFAFTTTLKDASIRISMDGRGRWMDNVFIERLWRSLKYECVFLNAFETGSEARFGIGRWIGYYNTNRPHSSFGGRTPEEVYAIELQAEKLAA